MESARSTGLYALLVGGRCRAAFFVKLYLDLFSQESYL